MLKRIAITGPESTGKSRLTSELAEYYQTTFVAEYARKYIEELNREYTYDDVLQIAKGQLQRENEAAATGAKKFLFCDTDFTVTKIWCDYKFKQCHEWINQQFIGHKYDLYLLCNTDLPWEYDPQRENPNEREALFQIYHETLKAAAFPFIVINGIGDERLKNAIKAVDKIF
jgi:NadR type nicotinamide-nucleotide adenylyltransferase